MWSWLTTQNLPNCAHINAWVYPIRTPIVREDNGLAMSTRNQYLNADEYRIASKLHKILKQIERGELDLQSATEQLQRYFKLDYLELLDAACFFNIDFKPQTLFVLLSE
jgi:pantoate--beta-alanine ligase